jgi:hypothetical protein
MTMDEQDQTEPEPGSVEVEQTNPHLTPPGISDGVSGVLRFLAHLTAIAGEPVSVDLSTLLAEITVSTPNMIVFQGWCDQLGLTDSVSGRSDELGTVAVGETDQSACWKIRLYCAMETRA